MKVRIEYTVEVSDEERLALGHNIKHSPDGKASREDVRDLFMERGTCGGNADLKELVKDYYHDLAKEYAEKARSLKEE